MRYSVLNRATVRVANTREVSSRVTAKSVKHAADTRRMTPPFHNRIRKVCPLVAAILIIPALAYAQNGTAENPAHNAVQLSADLAFPASGFGQANIIIPAGKIFVIETVSFFANVPGGILSRLAIQVDGPLITGGQGGVNYYPLIPPPNTIGFTQASYAVRLYAQPGTTLSINASETAGPSSHPAGLEVTLSGYFVNAP